MKNPDVEQFLRTRRRARASNTSAAFWYLLWQKAAFDVKQTRRAARVVPTGFTEVRIEEILRWTRGKAGRAVRRFDEEEYVRENAL